MKARSATIGFFIGLTWLTAWPGSARGESLNKAPNNIQVALFVKILALHKGIAGRKQDVIIHVVGDKRLAAAMKPTVGRKLGKSKLGAVKEGPPPADKSTGLGVICVGDPKQWEAVKAFCRKHRVLSVSGHPDLVGKGVTLVVGIAKKKPKVILDMTASKAEGAEWDPKILQLATQINQD